MHLLLSKLLQKRGIEDVATLSKEEKEWFEEKERILSLKDEVSSEDIKKFCQVQIGIIEDQWKNLDNTAIKNERLILTHTVYSTILKAINTSKREREILEDYLTQLIK